MEPVTDWQRLIEPWWTEKLALIEAQFPLTDDFLHATHEQDGGTYNLWGTFGVINVPYAAWERDWEELGVWRDRESMHDPVWGGLDRWPDLFDPAPNPPPISPTLVNQGRSLARLWGVTDVPDRIESLVHWGGGLGLQSILLRQWDVQIGTEYVIDLPVMSRVQHQYVGHEIGFDRVHLSDGTFQEGCVNLVPLPYAHLVPDAEVFLAQHSLNESTIEAQRWVAKERAWFGAEHLVLEWTEDHPYFAGSAHWAELVYRLEVDGRIPSRNRARGFTTPQPAEVIA